MKRVARILLGMALAALFSFRAASQTAEHREHSEGAGTRVCAQKRRRALPCVELGESASLYPVRNTGRARNQAMECGWKGSQEGLEVL